MVDKQNCKPQKCECTNGLPLAPIGGFRLNTFPMRINVAQGLCSPTGGSRCFVREKGLCQMRKIIYTLALLLCIFAATSVFAQQIIRVPGLTPVVSSAPTQAVTLGLAAGGTVASILVTSQGCQGFDFANAKTGSCTAGTVYLRGQSCSVDVTFKPVAPGERRGAVILLDRSKLSSRYRALLEPQRVQSQTSFREPSAL